MMDIVHHVIQLTVDMSLILGLSRTITFNLKVGKPKKKKFKKG